MKKINLKFDYENIDKIMSLNTNSLVVCCCFQSFVYTFSFFFIYISQNVSLVTANFLK